MLTEKIFLLTHSTVLILFSCTSCGSDINHELVHKVMKDVNVTEKQKVSITENFLSNREFISLPILSMFESPSLNENNLGSFGFRSSKAGEINYIGSCLSLSRNVIEGDNHIRFVAMVEGTYDDCAIQVKDVDGNMSEPLKVPTFSVDFTAPKLSQVGYFMVEGRNVKMDIKASESGKILYSGNCNGDLIYVKKGKSEIIIHFPGDGQYSDCELSLADVAGNVSEPLSLGTVRIDTTSPALTEIKPVPKKIETDRPSYSFKTSKSGNLTFSGKCKGNVEKAVAGVNHIALLTTEPGIYDDCKITLTDSSKKQSQPLKISPFEVLGNS